MIQATTTKQTKQGDKGYPLSSCFVLLLNNWHLTTMYHLPYITLQLCLLCLNFAQLSKIFYLLDFFYKDKCIIFFCASKEPYERIRPVKFCQNNNIPIYASKQHCEHYCVLVWRVSDDEITDPMRLKRPHISKSFFCFDGKATIASSF